MQVFNIIQGWFNLVFDLKTEEAKKKAKHCMTCKHKKHGKMETIEENKIVEVFDFYCDLCKCPLKAKLRSDSKCDIGLF